MAGRDDHLCVDISASSKLAENLGHPLATFLYTVSCMHCMTVSLADGGMGLGTMWGEQTALRMLGEAGFTSIEAKHVDGDDVRPTSSRPNDRLTCRHHHDVSRGGAQPALMVGQTAATASLAAARSKWLGS